MDLGSQLRDNLIGGDKKLVTEEILITTGVLVRGTVMGRIKQSMATSGTADGGNTGDGTVTVVTGGKKTQQGSYTIECIRAVAHGGEFSVKDPNGKFLGVVLITAGAGGTGIFKSDEINFTVTDGTNDFVVGDKFTVAATEGVPNTGVADGGNTGGGTMTVVEGRRDLRIGVYTMTCKTAVAGGGIFSVVDPDGNALPDATVGVAYVSDQIVFLLNDGTPDFIVGDKFTVTTTIHPRQCVPCGKTLTNGASEPYCVLAEAVDASSGSKRSTGYREGQFNERALVFASGTDIDDLRDMMESNGMYVVPSVPQGSV